MKALRTHKINYNGIEFEVGLFEQWNGRARKYENWYLAVIWNENGFSAAPFGGKKPLKTCLNSMSERLSKQTRSKALHDLADSLTTLEKIEHPNFAYARYKVYSNGPCYVIYWKDQDSPTGVCSVDGCSSNEWEEFSKLANKQNQYLAPSEKW